MITDYDFNQNRQKGTVTLAAYSHKQWPNRKFIHYENCQVSTVHPTQPFIEVTTDIEGPVQQIIEGAAREFFNLDDVTECGMVTISTYDYIQTFYDY